MSKCSELIERLKEGTSSSNSKIVGELYNQIYKALDSVLSKDLDPSITDFALAVSEIVKSEYGKHNSSNFIKTIKSTLK
jgi:hypothetical protein